LIHAVTRGRSESEKANDRGANRSGTLILFSIFTIASKWAGGWSAVAFIPGNGAFFILFQS